MQKGPSAARCRRVKLTFEFGTERELRFLIPALRNNRDMENKRAETEGTRACTERITFNGKVPRMLLLPFCRGTRVRPICVKSSLIGRSGFPSVRYFRRGVRGAPGSGSRGHASLRNGFQLFPPRDK